MKIPEETVRWLVESNIPHVQYNSKKLFCPGEENFDVLKNDPLITETIIQLEGWQNEVLKQHNKADLYMHRLAMLADLGVTKDFPGVASFLKSISRQCDSDGIPFTNIQLPKVFGGSDMAGLDWILCDFPLVLYFLQKMGVEDDQLQKAIGKLSELVDENGFRCKSSVSKFKGPGIKTDFCPMANLYAARVFSFNKKLRASKAADSAVEALLFHWEVQKEKKYRMFGIGSEFRKLKFPLVWYNILHVLVVLSEYEQCVNDPRFQEMCEVLLDKADDKMQFKAESMYRLYKTHDFADKKKSSPTISLIALGLLKKAGLVEV